MFDCPSDIYVNTVNCVGVSGKGVALECKKRFPNMFLQYRKDCQDGKVYPGSIFSYIDNGQQIINFATKNHWRNPSEYRWIDDGLRRFAQFLCGFQNDIVVSMPSIGCGNGGLDWSIVKPMIIDSIGNLGHRLYIYEPRSF